MKHSIVDGITLITIPFWWDGLLPSLASTIHLKRPDVVPISPGNPIPETMPKSAVKKYKFQPDMQANADDAY